MRQATLDLTPELFVEFSKASSARVRGARSFIVKENPLPDDAKVVRVGVANDGAWPQTLRLYLESEEFADVPDGDPIPELPLVVYETVYDE